MYELMSPDECICKMQERVHDTSWYFSICMIHKGPYLRKTTGFRPWDQIIGESLLMFIQSLHSFSKIINVGGATKIKVPSGGLHTVLLIMQPISITISCRNAPWRRKWQLLDSIYCLIVTSVVEGDLLIKHSVIKPAWDHVTDPELLHSNTHQTGFEVSREWF